MATGAYHCYTRQCKILLGCYCSCSCCRCCCCCSALHSCVPVCGYACSSVLVCVSAEDGVRTGEEEGKTYARVVCIYSTQMSGIRRFSFSDFPGVKNSEWKGVGGWTEWEGELRTTHSHLMLLHYFVVACFEWLRAHFFCFWFQLIWGMGEGLLTSWQQHKIQRKNVRKNMHRKITANKFTTLTALPRYHSPFPLLLLPLALSLEWGYWHCSSRAATSAAQLLRLSRC